MTWTFGIDRLRYLTGARIHTGALRSRGYAVNVKPRTRRHAASRWCVPPRCCFADSLCLPPSPSFDNTSLVGRSHQPRPRPQLRPLLLNLIRACSRTCAQPLRPLPLLTIPDPAEQCSRSSCLHCLSCAAVRPRGRWSSAPILCDAE